MLPMPDPGAVAVHRRRAELRLQLALNHMGKDCLYDVLPWLQEQATSHIP